MTQVRIGGTRAERTEWLNPETLIAYSPPGVGHYLDVQVRPFLSQTRTLKLTHSLTHFLTHTHTPCTYMPERVYAYTNICCHSHTYMLRRCRC